MVDSDSPTKSPEKIVDKEMSTKASKKTSKVRKKKTSDGSTSTATDKPKKSTSRKKSTKKESTKMVAAAAASSEDDQEDVYRSEANLIREESPERVDETIDTGNSKKSTSRKKRRSKMSTKKSVGEIESSPRFFPEDDPDFFPDPNLRLALQSLRDDVESLAGDISPSLSPGSQPPLSAHSAQPQLSHHQFPLLDTMQPNFPASQPVKQIYLQEGSGFSKANHRKLTKLSMANQIQPSSLKPSMTPLELGLESQKIFRSIGIFCHGFLAGLAFWQLIMVFVLADDNSDVLDFIAIYSPLSQPLHLIFYFLTVICTISILDRYDLAQFEWQQIQKMLMFRSGGIAIFVYLLSLLLTLVTTRLDDKISLYHINATLFEQTDPLQLESEISSWKILNLCRSLGVIIGWILVSLRPNTDLLYKHLKRLADFSNVHRDGKNTLP